MNELKDYNVCDIFRVFLASNDVRFAVEGWNEISNGDVLVYDLDGFGLKHLLKFLSDPKSLKAYLKYNQECEGLKFYQVHFINCSSLFSKLMAIVKPFLSKENADLIKFHAKLESLQDFISTECLPNEYGGTLGKLDDLNNEWMKIMMSKR